MSMILRHSVESATRKFIIVTTALATFGLLSAGSAAAVHGSSSEKLGSTGAIVQANAYSCNLFLVHCSWSTSTKVTKSGKKAKASTVRNTVTLHAYGIGAGISAPGFSASTSVGSGSNSASWTNYNAWISDLAGTAKPNLLTWGMSACSAGFALYKGVKKNPSACSW